MSSRALRKLQKEREQQKQLEASAQNVENDGTSEEEETPEVNSQIPNAFSMLNEADEEKGDESDIEEGMPSAGEEAIQGVAQAEKVTGKPKKKKNKKKGKGVEQRTASAKGPKAAEKGPELDEIDLALQSLSTKLGNSHDVDASGSARATIDEANAALFRLLAVESKHLNALNEMKRLFGNTVLEDEDEPVAAPRRRGRGQQQLDLGGALAGRNSPASRGQGLTGLVLRRNPFIQGKEEWPKAPSGGLSTELVEKFDDGTVEYRFAHNTMYQDVQRQFESCVESMNPQRMITLLQYNPYHISTLLQVSEIAKQQGDHSVSGDLLERALFSFGRSVQSSFITAILEGKARLDFRRPENREFWLAAWRYINNLGQRGTWRTAYEWAKLLLSFDPEGDPYSISLIIDQLAIRGGQSQTFLDLANAPFFRDDLWGLRPNIRISTALAEYKTKQAEKSRDSLTKALNAYPSIFSRLFQELNIDHIPKSIWGRTPENDRERFDCELYVHNAKDLWNTPEVVSFLVEVAESVGPRDKSASISSSENRPITQDEARHVLLAGAPSLINFIPREFTTSGSSSSDPLPPLDNLASYTIAPQASGPHVYEPGLEVADSETPPNEETPNPRSPEEVNGEVAQAQEQRGIAGFFRRLWQTGPPGQDSAPENAQPPDPEEINEVQTRAAENGAPPELIAAIAAMAAAQGGSRDEDLPNNPHAPRVEDDLDEDLQPPSPEQSSAPQIGPTDPYDDDRNQRWLAGQGMLRLKAITDQYGTDDGTWPSESGQSVLREYAQRMLQLRQQRTRDFLLNYTLRQGTSLEVKELVVREMGRLR